MLKKRRHFSATQMRLALITIFAVQFPNVLCIIFAQLSAAIADGSDDVILNFHDIDFTNITAIDLVSKVAMRRLHDDLDQNDDGNVSLSEGAKYLHKGEFASHGANSNLPGFEKDKDGRITEEEFWADWVQSAVHNWTVSEMIDWLSNEVELPQYAAKFKQHGISGAAMPILASNSSIVLSLVGGVKEHRLKLWLRALDVVVCGHTRSKSSLLKDVLLAVSVALAIGGTLFGFRVRQNAAQAVTAMQEKLNSLQKELHQTLDDQQDDDIIWIPTSNDECGELDSQMKMPHSGSDSSLSSDASLHSRLAEAQEELTEVRSRLEQAEQRLRLSERKWSPPAKLITCLKSTYQVEMKLHEIKRQQAQKKVEHATLQFQKMKKKVSIFSTVHFIHSRQVDSFDIEVQLAKDALKSVQRDTTEQRKRWAELESLCKCKFMTSHPPSTPAVQRPQRMTSKRSSTENASLQRKASTYSTLSTSTNASVLDSSESLDKLGSLRDLPREKPKSVEEKQTNKKSSNSYPSLTDYVAMSQSQDSALIPRSQSEANFPTANNNNSVKPSLRQHQKHQQQKTEDEEAIEQTKTSDCGETRAETPPTAEAAAPPSSFSSNTFPRKRASPAAPRKSVLESLSDDARSPGAVVAPKLDVINRVIMTSSAQKSASSLSLPDLIGDAKHNGRRGNPELVKQNTLNAADSASLKKNHKKSFVQGLFRKKEKSK